MGSSGMSRKTIRQDMDHITCSIGNLITTVMIRATPETCPRNYSRRNDIAQYYCHILAVGAFGFELRAVA